MALGLKRRDVLSITGVSKHYLYYQSRGQRKGRLPSQTTRRVDATTGQEQWVANATVVERIRLIKADTDHNHYYKSITVQLCLEGYFINHKKVYRLMRESMLLQTAKRAKGRNFVKFRRVCPTRPLQILEMDIKYFWIVGEKTYAYVLTVIDTFTRYALAWKVDYHMKQKQVKEVWEYLIATYLQGLDLRQNGGVQIEVRNDNGKQFSAHMVQAFFAENYLGQVFTHPYTPEENAHVESFHKTIGKALKNETFDTLWELHVRLERFYGTYNNHRCHGSIAMLSPAYFWALFDDQLIRVTVKPKRRLVFKTKVSYQQVVNQPQINRYFYPIEA